MSQHRIKYDGVDPHSAKTRWIDTSTVHQLGVAGGIRTGRGLLRRFAPALHRSVWPRWAETPPAYRRFLNGMIRAP
jgi:hypothetical protein